MKKSELRQIIKEELLKEARYYYSLHDTKAKNKLQSLSKTVPQFVNSVLEYDQDFDVEWFDAIIKNMQYIRSKVEKFKTSD